MDDVGSCAGWYESKENDLAICAENCFLLKNWWLLWKIIFFPKK